MNFPPYAGRFRAAMSVLLRCEIFRGRLGRVQDGGEQQPEKLSQVANLERARESVATGDK